jgi:hypothetical protein
MGKVFVLMQTCLECARRMMALVLIDGRKTIFEVNETGFIRLCNTVSKMTEGEETDAEQRSASMMCHLQSRSHKL